MNRFLLVLLLPLFASGCSFGELLSAAGEKNPSTGRTPVQDILVNTPNVIDNPLDLNSWAELLSSLTILFAAGFGMKEWRKLRRGEIALPYKEFAEPTSGNGETG